MADEPATSSENVRSDNSQQFSAKTSEGISNPGFANYSNLSGMGTNTETPTFPYLFSGVLESGTPPEQQSHQYGSGIYLVPVHPFPAYPHGNLIPVTYNLPSPTSVPRPDNTREESGRGSSAEAHSQPAEGGLRQQHGGPANAPEQRNGQPRRVVRRMIEIHLDLLLIMKLAVVVFIFNQDGSPERLFVLLFIATLVYLYQTGTMAPLLQWLSQRVRQARLHQPQAAAAQPEQPGQPDGHQEGANIHAAQNVEGQNPQPPVPQQVLNDDNREDGRAENQQGFNWWRIAKELQMIAVEFVTSLLPGYHHHAD